MLKRTGWLIVFLILLGLFGLAATIDVGSALPIARGDNGAALEARKARLRRSPCVVGCGPVAVAPAPVPCTAPCGASYYYMPTRFYAYWAQPGFTSCYPGPGNCYFRRDCWYDSFGRRFCN
jgi:hypothetical protein